VNLSVWKKPGAPHIVLALLCLLYLILFVNRVNISTAAPLMKADLKLTNTQLGLVFSAFAIPYAIFQLIGGWVGDKFGPRLTLSLCCALVGVSTILTGAAQGFVSLFALRVALGFGEGAAFPTATRAMSRWTPVRSWGFAQGITHSFARLGNAITPPIMAVLLLFISWRGSFVVLGLASFVWLFVWAGYFRNEPEDHPAITAADLAALPVRNSANTEVIPWWLLARRILPVTMVDFCYGWTLWLFLSWLPQYFLHSFSLDMKKSAIFASSVFFAGVIGDTLGGIVTDRILIRTGSVKKARSTMVSVCMLLSLAALLPLLFTHDLTVSVVCLSAGFFFAEMTIGPMWAIPMDVAGEFAGTASGMMNTGSALAALVSPIIGGWLIDATGNWDLPFAGSMMLMGLGVLLAFRMQPDSKFILPHAGGGRID